MRKLITAAAFILVVAPAWMSAAQDVYKPGNGVRSPVLVREVKPQYTKGAMDRKVQGIVEMECVVLKDGSVDDNVKVTKSLDEELDQQAILALKQWRFRPGTKDGEPVPVQVNVEMSFTLRDRK
jgi:TonB family protein